MNLITQGIIELIIGLGIGVLLNQTFRFERKRANQSKEPRELRNYTIQKGSLKWMIDREFKKRNQLKN